MILIGTELGNMRLWPPERYLITGVARRLGVTFFLEASRMLEEGVASVEDIDKAMRLGYGHRMGSFETCDLVGLDTLLKQLVSAGYLGKKNGQ